MWGLQAIGATPPAAYSAAKAGVHALTKNLAIELAPYKIRVNAIAPGVTETPVFNTFLTPEQWLPYYRHSTRCTRSAATVSRQTQRKRFCSSHPIRRVSLPAWCCRSTAASWPAGSDHRRSCRAKRCFGRLAHHGRGQTKARAPCITKQFHSARKC